MQVNIPLSSAPFRFSPQSYRDYMPDKGPRLSRRCVRDGISGVSIAIERVSIGPAYGRVPRWLFGLHQPRPRQPRIAGYGPRLLSWTSTSPLPKDLSAVERYGPERP